MNRRLFAVTVALGLFAAANPLPADGPREGVKKTVTVVENRSIYRPMTTCIPTYPFTWGTIQKAADWVKRPGNEWRKVNDRAKATKQKAASAGNSAKQFFVRNWQKWGW